MNEPEFINGLGWVDDPEEYPEWSDRLSAEAQQLQNEQREQEDDTRSTD